MEEGVSCQLGFLSPLLFVLWQILNVCGSPLAILCMSACLNIIISAGKGSFSWERFIIREQEGGDYIKNEECVLSREHLLDK